MVVGLVVLSGGVALISATLSVLLGGSWLAALCAYLLAGMVTTFLLLGRLLLCEAMAGATESPPHRRRKAAQTGSPNEPV